MWARMRLLKIVNFFGDLWVTNSLTTALIQRNAGIIKDDFLNSSLNTTALGSHGYVLYSMSQIGLLGCLDVTSTHASTTYDSDPNVKTTEFNDPKTFRPRDIKSQKWTDKHPLWIYMSDMAIMLLISKACTRWRRNLKGSLQERWWLKSAENLGAPPFKGDLSNDTTSSQTNLAWQSL
jgi:hypothetical protein